MVPRAAFMEKNVVDVGGLAVFSAVHLFQGKYIFY